MHVAPQIAVHCWQYAPDVGPAMPIAPDDVIIHCGYQRLSLDGAVIGTFEHCSFIFLIEPQLYSEAIL